MNGDGYADLIIGAPDAPGDPNGPNNGINRGEAYIVFGGPSFSASLSVESLDGTNGFVIRGLDGLVNPWTGRLAGSAGTLRAAWRPCTGRRGQH